METENDQEQKVAEPEVLSKRQKKKLEKLKKFMENKKQMRENERAKRRAKKELLKEQGIRSTGPSRKMLKRNKIQLENAPFNIAIDLSFDDLMTDKSVSSCVSQLLRIYATNRRSKRPVPVYFTGLEEGSKVSKRLEMHEGSKNWDVIRSEKSYLDLFERDKIVYLTSESEDTLDKLETGFSYIIGGIVDHNSQKGLTYDLARKHNIKTAKLPLQEHIQMPSRAVLTINQCFDILIGIGEGREWKDVIMEVIPQRKMPKLKQTNDNQKNDESKNE